MVADFVWKHIVDDDEDTFCDQDCELCDYEGSGRLVEGRRPIELRKRSETESQARD